MIQLYSHNVYFMQRDHMILLLSLAQMILKLCTRPIFIHCSNLLSARSPPLYMYLCAFYLFLCLSLLIFFLPLCLFLWPTSLYTCFLPSCLCFLSSNCLIGIPACPMPCMDILLALTMPSLPSYTLLKVR